MNASFPTGRRALPWSLLSLAGLLLAGCSSAPAEQPAPPPTPGCTSDSQCTPYHACSAGTCVALLDPPANLQATPGTGVVDLSWDARPGATSYVVSAATREAPPEWTKLGEGAGTGAHIFNVPDDTTVYFVVQAANSLGVGAPSAPVSATTALQTLNAIGLGTSIVLRWTAIETDPHFDVFRSAAASGPFERVAASVRSPWADQGLGDAQTRWYRIRPSAGGADSNTVSAITRPAAPTAVAATSDSSGDLLVTWQPSAGARSYLIRGTTLLPSSFGFALNGTAASLRLSSIGAPIRYQLSVVALDDAGESEPSAPVSGLTAPAVNAIFSGPGRVHLTLATGSESTIAISRGPSQQGPWTPFATAFPTGSFVDTLDSDAPPWTTVWYRAQSIDPDGPGDSSFASIETIGLPDINNAAPINGSGCEASADFDGVGFAEQGFTPGVTGTLMGVQASVSFSVLNASVEAHVLDGNGTDLGHATLPPFGGSCPQPLTESIRIMYADLSQSGIHVTAGTPLRLQLRFAGPSGAFAQAGITADAYPGELTALRAPPGPHDLILRTFIKPDAP